MRPKVNQSIHHTYAAAGDSISAGMWDSGDQAVPSEQSHFSVNAGELSLSFTRFSRIFQAEASGDHGQSDDMRLILSAS
jgi:hypothetical protein